MKSLLVFYKDLCLRKSTGHLGDRLYGFLPCHDEVCVYVCVWLSEVVLIHGCSLKFPRNLKKKNPAT